MIRPLNPRTRSGLTAWQALRCVEPDLAVELVARVRRGARLLDSESPGWHRRLAGDRLAMESCDRCVLGQLYGDYLDGFRHVLRNLPSQNLYSAAMHGFTLFEHEQHVEDSSDAAQTPVLARFAALADLWRHTARGRVSPSRMTRPRAATDAKAEDGL